MTLVLLPVGKAIPSHVELEAAAKQRYENDGIKFCTINL